MSDPFDLFADLPPLPKIEPVGPLDDPVFGAPVYVRTRRQALEDGDQVQAPADLSRQAGIRWPVYLTRTVWDAYVEVPEGVRHQDLTGRLWDILCMLRYQMKLCSGDRLEFSLRVRLKEGTRRVVLKAMVGPIDVDDPAPAITVMQTDED